MNGRLTYGISLVLGILSLILLIANVAMINSNRHMQDEVNQRQADINKGNALTSLNQGLIQALADVAANKGDAEAKGLLAAQGITLNPAATAAVKK